MISFPSNALHHWNQVLVLLKVIRSLILQSFISQIGSARVLDKSMSRSSAEYNISFSEGITSDDINSCCDQPDCSTQVDHQCAIPPDFCNLAIIFLRLRQNANVVVHFGPKLKKKPILEISSTTSVRVSRMTYCGQTSVHANNKTTCGQDFLASSSHRPDAAS